MMTNTHVQAKAVEMLERGDYHKDISAALGIGMGAVAYISRKAGIQRRGKYNTRLETRAIAEKWAARVRAGERQRVAAEALGTTRQAVTLACKRYGIEYPKGRTNPSYTVADRIRVLKRYNAGIRRGMTMADAAKPQSHYAIHKWARQLGVELEDTFINLPDHERRAVLMGSYNEMRSESNTGLTERHLPGRIAV